MELIPTLPPDHGRARDHHARTGVGAVRRQQGVDVHARQQAAGLHEEIPAFRLEFRRGLSDGRDQRRLVPFAVLALQGGFLRRVGPVTRAGLRHPREPQLALDQALVFRRAVGDPAGQPRRPTAVPARPAAPATRRWRRGRPPRRRARRPRPPAAPWSRRSGFRRAVSWRARIRPGWRHTPPPAPRRPPGRRRIRPRLSNNGCRSSTAPSAGWLGRCVEDVSAATSSPARLISSGVSFTTTTPSCRLTRCGAGAAAWSSASARARGRTSASSSAPAASRAAVRPGN